MFCSGWRKRQKHTHTKKAQWHLPFFCQDGATIRDATISDDQCEADIFTESLFEHNTREQIARWGHFVDRLQPIAHDWPLLHPFLSI